ncbi:MAG TPA: hypothetical protein VI035_05485 [Solirubrobacterales bacterium]
MLVPLLAIESADRYVGGAYLVFLLLLLVYVAIMAAKLSRIQRELGSLAELAERPPTRSSGHDVGEIREREQEIGSVREETQREEAAR